MLIMNKEILRLLAALLCGFVIGIDRGLKRRGAGIRTHILVCIGSAVVMLISEKLIEMYPQYVGDVGRLGAQVISGVGFLGVGTIIVTGNKHIRGLTTAAGLWATACIGLAIGIGYYTVAVIATVLIMFTFRVLGAVDGYLHRHSVLRDYYIEIKGENGIMEILNLTNALGFKLGDIEIKKSNVNANNASLLISIEGKNHDDFIHKLNELPFVEYIEIRS